MTTIATVQIVLSLDAGPLVDGLKLLACYLKWLRIALDAGMRCGRSRARMIARVLDGADLEGRT